MRGSSRSVFRSSRAANGKPAPRSVSVAALRGALCGFPGARRFAGNQKEKHMRLDSTLIFLLASAVPVVSQSETSPKGFLTTEGAASMDSLLGYYSTAYGYGVSYLHVDATNIGAPRTIRYVALRRDGVKPNNASYVGRTIKLSIRMAHADWSKVKNNTPQNDADFRLGAWTDITIGRVVRLPDILLKPNSGTAPFNVVLPFDVPFVYDGVGSLAIALLGSPNTDLSANSTPYPLDTAYFVQSIAKQTVLGKGCVPTGNTVPMEHNSYLVSYGPNSTTSWTVSSRYGPPNAPQVTLIGTANPDLAFGGCEKLLTTANLLTLTAVTDGEGAAGHELKLTHSPQYIGLRLYSQTAALDAGIKPIPWAISNGMEIVYPIDSPGPLVTRASQLTYGVNPPWPTTHTLYPKGGAIFGLFD
jgi:hypothetical protein